MAYFSTSQVEVFPSTYRNEGTGKFTSEQNFANIINSLVDKASFQNGDDGFVLDYPAGASSGLLKVIIHGYYFEVANFTPSSATQVLEIRIADTAEYLANHNNASTTLDNGGRFEGLFSNSEPTSTPAAGYTYYHVHVCDASGKIINRARLVSDSVKFISSGKLSKSVTEELNAKQYDLVNGQGIADITNNQAGNNVVKLTDNEYAKLTSLPNKGASGSKLVYFDANGKAIDSAKTTGHALASSANYYNEQGMYIINGEIKPGFTVWAGKGDAPANAAVGDIYFKYQ